MDNNQNQIWRCPECETVNKETTCIVCGTEKPKITTANNQYNKNTNNQSSLNEKYIEPSIEESINDNQKNNVVILKKQIRVLLVIMWLLIIITLVFGIVLIKNADDDSENNSIADSNARLVYSNALRYCVQCIANGKNVTDGEYTGDLSSKLSTYSFDGTKEDLDEYLSHMIGGNEETGFFKITIKNGIPESVQWNLTNNFDELNNDSIIGKYPVYGVLNTSEISLSYLNKNAGEKVEIEKNIDTTIDKNTSEITSADISEKNQVSDISEEIQVSEISRKIDENVFCYELLNCINSERKELGCAALSDNTKLKDILIRFMDDYKSGKYVKGTMKEYFRDSGYGEFQNYYEEKFDLNVYEDEKQAAKAILKYETENFSNQWIYSKWNDGSVAISENDDGTYFVTWGMACEKINQESDYEKVDSITIRNEDYSTELTELYLGTGTTANDIKDLDKMRLLENLSIVPYDGGCVVVEYDGEIIEDISVLKHLNKLTELRINWTKIKSINSLSELVNLKHLNLSNNEIEDIASLSGLVNLEYLELYDNQINDINSLKELRKLEYLDISNNPIKDISVLSNLTNLKTLHIGNYSSTLGAYLKNDDVECFSDISSLRSLKQLTKLSLYNTNTQDISALSNLSSLEHLYLNGNQIKSIDALLGLTELKNLNLSDNDITDISGIKNLIKLENLYLSGNYIKDLSEICLLPNLEYLSIEISGSDDIEQVMKLNCLNNLKSLSICMPSESKLTDAEEQMLEESFNCDIGFMWRN